MKNKAVLFLTTSIIFAVFILSGCSLQMNEPIGGYEFAKYNKYNSEASKNDLDGTKIYIYGTCTDVANINGVESAYISDGSKKWIVGLWDTTKLGEKDFSSLIDEKIYVFGEYLGYSDVADRPAMLYESILCKGMSYDFTRIALGADLDIPKPEPEPEPTVVIEATDEPELIDDGYINEKILDNGEFDYNPRYIFNLLFEEYDKIQDNKLKYSYEDYDITYLSSYVSKDKFKRIIVYSQKDTTKAACVVLMTKDNADDTTKSELIKQFNDLLSALGVREEKIELFNNQLIGDNLEKVDGKKASYDGVNCELKWEDDNMLLYVYPEITPIDISSIETNIVRKQDFLKDDDRRNLVKKSLDSHDYAKIIELADIYIQSENPKEDDSVFEIKSFAEQCIEMMDDYVVSYDEKEDEYYLHYRGIEEIDESNNFVPFIKDNLLYIRIGYQGDERGLYQLYSIFVDDDCITGTLTQHKGPINSKIIYEDVSFTSEQIDAIINSRRAVLECLRGRLYNRKIQYREKIILKAIVEFSEYCGGIADIIYDWENA